MKCADCGGFTKGRSNRIGKDWPALCRDCGVKRRTARKKPSMTYNALHFWIRKLAGPPTKCEGCGRKRKPNDSAHFWHWSSKKAKPTRNRADWQMMCALCHNHYDVDVLGKKVTPMFQKKKHYHGTTVMYRTDGCRCAPCKNAYKKASMKWRRPGVERPV